MELNSDGLERVSPTETNEVKCISTFLSTWLIMQASIQEMGCSALFFPNNSPRKFCCCQTPKWPKISLVWIMPVLVQLLYGAQSRANGQKAITCRKPATMI